MPTYPLEKEAKSTITVLSIAICAIHKFNPISPEQSKDNTIEPRVVYIGAYGNT